MRTAITVWWVQRDLRKCLRIARQMPEASRQWVARDVEERSRVLMIRKRVDGSLTIPWLERQLAGDITRRHLALRDGASSYSDPRWLRAAILEAWTMLLIHEARGTLAPKKMLVAEEEIGSVLHLSRGCWRKAMTGDGA